MWIATCDVSMMATPVSPRFPGHPTSEILALGFERGIGDFEASDEMVMFDHGDPRKGEAAGRARCLGIKCAAVDQSSGRVLRQLFHPLRYGMLLGRILAQV